MDSLDFRLDFENSNICRIYFWNPQGVRVALDPIVDCAEVKRNLASQVADQKILESSVAELLRHTEISDRTLPDSGPSYVGADYQVARARYIAGGMELTIGPTKYKFNARGLLYEISENKSRIEIKRDSNDRIAAISDDTTLMQYSYLDNGLVSRISFNDGSEYEYSYDRRYNLTGVTQGGEVHSAYAYDDNGRMTSAKQARDSHELRISYLPDGSRKSVHKGQRSYHWSFLDDSNGMPKVEQIIRDGDNQENRTYLFDYQERRLNLQIGTQTRSYVLTQCMCLPLESTAQGETSTYTYDPFGRLVGAKYTDYEIRQDYDDRVNKINRISRRSQGQDWEILGEAKYDDAGNLVEVRDQDKKLHISYDSNRNISKIARDGRESAIDISYNRAQKPATVAAAGIGTLNVTYREDLTIDSVKAYPEDEPSVAITVASMFNSLLDAMGSFEDAISLDTEFDLVTSEPGGCRECSRGSIW